MKSAIRIPQYENSIDSRLQISFEKDAKLLVKVMRERANQINQMTVNDTFKQLMLGLVYPAVLGTVLYTVLGAALDPFLSVLLGHSRTVGAPWVKWVLLLTTVAFYCCDYLYIMFTRQFSVAFFLCDLVLLAGLYITVLTIDITTAVFPHRNLVLVAACYLGFMVLYLMWDLFERFNTGDRAEQRFYNKVIYWESSSILIVVAWLVFDNQRNALLAVLLLLITIRFAVLAMQKRVFYKESFIG